MNIAFNRNVDKISIQTINFELQMWANCDILWSGLPPDVHGCLFAIKGSLQLLWTSVAFLCSSCGCSWLWLCSCGRQWLCWAAVNVDVFMSFLFLQLQTLAALLSSCGFALQHLWWEEAERHLCCVSASSNANFTSCYVREAVNGKKQVRPKT